MSNAMPVSWVPKTMTLAVIKIVNYDGVQVLFVGESHVHTSPALSHRDTFHQHFLFECSFRSDKNSPCCQGCQFMTAGIKCREAQYATCEQEARCTGNQSECPKSPPMADGTTCQERGQCRGGKCIPYCETQGLQSCMCDIIQDACKR